MTLKETIKKIDSLQYLIGQSAPKWHSPIIGIIPAPANAVFTKYMELYKRTGDYEKGISKIKSKEFDVLLLFGTANQFQSIVYEWYGFFYTDQHKTPEQIKQYETKLKKRYFEFDNQLLVA